MGLLLHQLVTVHGTLIRIVQYSNISLTVNNYPVVTSKELPTTGTSNDRLPIKNEHNDDESHLNIVDKFSVTS